MKKIMLLLSVAFLSTTLLPSCGSTSSSAQQAVLDNIMTRSSVRSYTNQGVEPEKIEAMLRAAMAAPTGSNKQPWEFIIVTDVNRLSQLSEVTGGMRMAAKAPLAIIVLGDENISASWTLDCSAATQNILLAAHSMGLGAVWCGAYPENESGRAAKMKSLFNLPDGVNALNAIIIGYPDSEPQPKDKWRHAKVHYDDKY